MKNLFKNFAEACHKKNCQVKDGEHDSTIFPETFSLGGYKSLLHIPRSDEGSLLTHPEIYPQNFIYHGMLLFVVGSDK